MLVEMVHRSASIHPANPKESVRHANMCPGRRRLVSIEFFNRPNSRIGGDTDAVALAISPVIEHRKNVAWSDHATERGRATISSELRNV